MRSFSLLCFDLQGFLLGVEIEFAYMRVKEGRQDSRRNSEFGIQSSEGRRKGRKVRKIKALQEELSKFRSLAAFLHYHPPAA